MDYHSDSWNAHNKTHTEFKHLHPAFLYYMLKTQDNQSNLQTNG